MKLLALGLTQLGLSLYFWVLLSVIGRQDPNSWKTMMFGALLATPITAVLARYARRRTDGLRGGLKSIFRAVLIGYPALGAAGYAIAVMTFGPEGSYAGWGLALWAPAYAIAFPIGLGLLRFQRPGVR